MRGNFGCICCIADAVAIVVGCTCDDVCHILKIDSRSIYYTAVCQDLVGHILAYGLVGNHKFQAGRVVPKDRAENIEYLERAHGIEFMVICQSKCLGLSSCIFPLSEEGVPHLIRILDVDYLIIGEISI